MEEGGGAALRERAGTGNVNGRELSGKAGAGAKKDK